MNLSNTINQLAKSNEKFKIPLQGKYLDDVSRFTKDYKDQNPGSANAENQIPDNLKRK